MFFKEIEKQLTEGVPMHISLMKKAGVLTVITTLLEVKPLSIAGTADELDAEYFKILATPIELAKGLKTNLKEVESSIKETIKEESKPKKEAVVAKAPVKVKTKTLKEAIADGDKLFEEKKYQEAVDLFDNLFMNNPENKILPVKLQKAKQWLKATTEADIFAPAVDIPAHKSEAMNAAGKVEHAKQEAKQVNVDLNTFVEEAEEIKEQEAPSFDDAEATMMESVKEPLFDEQGRIPSVDGNEFDFEIPTM